MRWIPLTLLPVAAIVTPYCAQATTYLTTEQAQQAIFPGAQLSQQRCELTDAQRAIMLKRSGVREPFKTERVWRIQGGGVLIIDEVVGKHETIQYAVGINKDDSIKQIEIMSYYETYGSEIRQAAWRQQFVGKTSQSPLMLNDDIKNISGATLSCKHVTDGVKRVLAFYELVMKGA